LEFNLEKHRDCEYSDSLYEFLFTYEKEDSARFVEICKKGNGLGYKSSTNKGSENFNKSLESRSSVCLKFPLRRTNMVNSILTMGSSKVMGMSKGVGQRKSVKNLKPLSFAGGKSPLVSSPYYSLSPRAKDVVCRSPRVVRRVSKLV